MINYIFADIIRISRKKSFLSTLGVYILLFLLMIFIYENPNFNGEAFIAKTDTFLGFFPLIIGLTTFLSIYYDDFKSKSMQVAIGYGMSRNKVVLSKFFETIIISVLSALCVGIVILLMSFILDQSLTDIQYTELGLTLVAEILRTIGYISISTVFVYFTQNSVVGTIIFVLLSSKTVMIFAGMALGQSIIVNTFGDLTKYLYTILLYSEKSNYIQTGHFNLTAIMAILIYVILPTIIAIFSFRKKELEF